MPAARPEAFGRPRPRAGSRGTLRRPCIRFTFAACAVAVLAACGTLRQSALKDVFPQGRTSEPPLIVVPGVLASRLTDADTGQRVWPPSLIALIRGWRMHDLAVPLPYQGGLDDRRMDAMDIVLSRPRRDYYSGLRDALAAVGYECVPQHDLDADTNCVLFAWDWRSSFVAAAAALDEVVERLRAERGEPTLQIDVVAHSAGAMVARYFAQYGGTDVLDGGARGPAAATEPRIRRMALVGPPNRGSVVAAQSLMRGYRLGWFTVWPEVLATFDSAYELLPHPDRDWIKDVRGQPVELDIYDIDTWRGFRASIFDPEVRERVAARAGSPTAADRHLSALEERFDRGLARARRFHAAISSPMPGETAPARYLVIGSDCERTPRYFITETTGGRDVLRPRPTDVAERIEGIDYEALMLEPGDGRVTRASLLALRQSNPELERGADSAAVPAAFVCERHAAMTSNFEVQRRLLEFLLE